VIKVADKRPSDAASERMFDREFEVLGSASHPTLLSFRGFVPVKPDCDALPAIVMEFVGSGSLQTLIDGERKNKAPSRWDDGKCGEGVLLG
jgi:serine/threonine protein kinase